MSTPFTQDDERGLWAEQGESARIDYAVSWADWLQAGDSIASSVWKAQDGLQVEDGGIVGADAVVWVSGGKPGEWYWLRNAVTSAGGRREVAECLVHVRPGAAARSAVFGSRGAALVRMRDSLKALGESILPDAQFSNDVLWAKILAAEVELAGLLQVPLEPTEIFPSKPTAAELLALDGRPYMVEVGYDMPPDFFASGMWGALQLRQRPVLAVTGLSFVYPSLSTSVFNVPLDWIRLDAKYGQIRLFPTGQVVTAPLSIFVLQAMGQGTNVPHMIRVRYRAGIDASLPEFADVRELVLHGAGLRILQDLHVPQSSSVSADGLSQSESLDVSKGYEDWLARVESVRQRICGPVWGVL